MKTPNILKTSKTLKTPKTSKGFNRDENYNRNNKNPIYTQMALMLNQRFPLEKPRKYSDGCKWTPRAARAYYEQVIVKVRKIVKKHNYFN